mmetsp:Transcript_16852/g.25948  ORF Transcript_16852/g.25948 Transcript_16852/m.25948 type:complete len:88 (+) Transcript_16852:1555-1818(+)
MELAKKYEQNKPSELAKREKGVEEPKPKKHALVLDPKKMPKRKTWEKPDKGPADLTIIKEELSMITKPKEQTNGKANLDNYDMEIEL